MPQPIYLLLKHLLVQTCPSSYQLILASVKLLACKNPFRATNRRVRKHDVIFAFEKALCPKQWGLHLGAECSPSQLE